MSSTTAAASTGRSPTSPESGPPVPHSFGEFLRAFGPGIVIVLTWLGAGDIVDMGVAGSNYHYALLWVLVAAIFMRFVFVSLIARYCATSTAKASWTAWCSPAPSLGGKSGESRDGKVGTSRLSW